MTRPKKISVNELVSYTIRVDPDVLAQIETKAAELGVSKSEWTREALQIVLDGEQQFLEQLDKRVKKQALTIPTYGLRFKNFLR